MIEFHVTKLSILIYLCVPALSSRKDVVTYWHLSIVYNYKWVSSSSHCCKNILASLFYSMMIEFHVTELPILICLCIPALSSQMPFVMYLISRNFSMQGAWEKEEARSKSWCSQRTYMKSICKLILFFGCMQRGLFGNPFPLFEMVSDLVIVLCRPRSDFESFLNIGVWFKKHLNAAAWSRSWWFIRLRN